MRLSFFCILIAAAAICQASCDSAGGSVFQPYFYETDLFVSGSDGYAAYRIPSLLVTGSGSLLAFCEGRRNSASDSGDIDIVVRRSDDNGATWGPIELVVDYGEETAGNPCPVVDRADGTIWLPYTTNLASDTQLEIMFRLSRGTREVHVTRSTDDGRVWESSRNITADVKEPNWTWYGTGPGVGIQLPSGRLLIPSYHDTWSPMAIRQKNYHSHVVYSDDHGLSWHIGGIVGAPTDESQAAWLDDGRIMMNARTGNIGGSRSVSLSQDEGMSWSRVHRDPVLLCPVGGCQASIIGGDPGILYFSNPASLLRKRMTVRQSTDNGLTWNVSKVLNPGLSAYSSLALLPNGNLACMYEKGDDATGVQYDRIRLVQFSLDWLSSPD